MDWIQHVPIVNWVHQLTDFPYELCLLLVVFPGLFSVRWIINNYDLKKVGKFEESLFILIIGGIWVIRGISVILFGSLVFEISLTGFFIVSFFIAPIILASFLDYKSVKNIPFNRKFLVVSSVFGTIFQAFYIGTLLVELEDLTFNDIFFHIGQMVLGTPSITGITVALKDIWKK